MTSLYPPFIDTLGGHDTTLEEGFLPQYLREQLDNHRFKDYFAANAPKIQPVTMLVGHPLNIPEGYVSLLYGQGKLGKSKLAYHLAISVALGIDFFGAKVNPGKALIADFEAEENAVVPDVLKVARGLGIDSTSWV